MANQKIENQFIDHLKTILNLLNRYHYDHLPVHEQYQKMILESLEGNYDDLEDYLDIQTALIKVLELNNRNIQQCLKLKASNP